MGLAVVVGDELFRLSVVVLDLLSWMVLLIGAFAAIWLLDEVLRIACSCGVGGYTA